MRPLNLTNSRNELDRLRAVFDEGSKVLKKYDLTIPDLYREYVFRARGSTDVKFGSKGPE